MTVCAVCDQPVLKSDPRKTISGQPAHEYCDAKRPSRICMQDGCAWIFTDHAGPHS